MDVRSIERVPLSHVDDVEANLRGDVLARALKLFNYTADAFGAAGPLAKAMAALDIAPLDTAQVDQYKKSKARSRTTHWQGLTHAALTSGLALNVVFNCWHLANWDKPPISLGVALVGILIGNFVISFVFQEEKALRQRTYTWVWHRYGLRNYEAERNSQGSGYMPTYTRYIPVHVLRKATQLAEACPKATFGVDELALTIKKVPRPLPDPFLWVKLGAEMYYIEVWDEREFEAKM
jgi:xanthosine utilization system XapX-like protein